ncbi:hypothetical protein [Tardiphaga sp.]|uniref:hypothetical protein n=1 Tax=Tardiphaga sp. TaxID=1926292 RepID=UPI0025FB5B9C|nr:hypothetical protein [Tardiphaga sp.]
MPAATGRARENSLAAIAIGIYQPIINHKRSRLVHCIHRGRAVISPSQLLRFLSIPVVIAAFVFAAQISGGLALRSGITLQMVAVR